MTYGHLRAACTPGSGPAQRSVSSMAKPKLPFTAAAAAATTTTTTTTTTNNNNNNNNNPICKAPECQKTSVALYCYTSC